jgi:thioredoxin 1
MKKSGVVIITIILFLAVGGLIIAWSVYRSPEQDLGGVRSFTDENFRTEVVETSKTKPVLVDFYASWCVPCYMLEPILEEVAKDLKGKAVIGKVDTDRNMISRRFGVQRVPTIFIIRNGEVKDAISGVPTKKRLIEMLKRFGAS